MTLQSGVQHIHTIGCRRHFAAVAVVRMLVDPHAMRARSPPLCSDSCAVLIAVCKQVRQRVWLLMPPGGCCCICGQGQGCSMICRRLAYTPGAPCTVKFNGHQHNCSAHPHGMCAAYSAACTEASCLEPLGCITADGVCCSSMCVETASSTLLSLGSGPEQPIMVLLSVCICGCCQNLHLVHVTYDWWACDMQDGCETSMYVRVWA
jgi:hypothetical protein